jgi:hypothetical protein
MQERRKWAYPRRNFSQGDIVIIADATDWQSSEYKTGLRSICIQTKTSVLERPVTKICLLLEATA